MVESSISLWVNEHVSLLDNMSSPLTFLFRNKNKLIFSFTLQYVAYADGLIRAYNIHTYAVHYTLQREKEALLSLSCRIFLYILIQMAYIFIELLPLLQLTTL